MKTSSTKRILGLSFVLSALLISSSSFAALNAYLKLKGSNGKTYTTTADASGKFSFSNVEPGTYKLLWVLPPGEGAPTGSCSIEIASWSSGGSNKSSVGSTGMSSGKTAAPATGKTSDYGGGGSTGKVQFQDFHFTTNASKLSKDGDNFYAVVFEDILVSSISSPSGNVSNMTATYDLKMMKK